MKMQMTVVSQKMKSIPSRSSDAFSGSHGMKNAKAKATAMAARPDGDHGDGGSSAQPGREPSSWQAPAQPYPQSGLRRCTCDPHGSRETN